MAAKKPLANYAGALKEITSPDVVEPATLGSGTPDGTVYLRGDSTWATPTAALPDLVKVRNDTNGNQTIPTGYSAIIPCIYDIGVTDLLDIVGTGILEIT